MAINDKSERMWELSHDIEAMMDKAASSVLAQSEGEFQKIEEEVMAMRKAIDEKLERWAKEGKTRRKKGKRC